MQKGSALLHVQQHLVLQEFHGQLVGVIRAKTADVYLIIHCQQRLQVYSLQIDMWVVLVLPKPQTNPHALPWQQRIESQGSKTDSLLLNIGAVSNDVPDVQGEGGGVCASRHSIVAKGSPTRKGERELMDQLLLRCEFNGIPIEGVKELPKGYLNREKEKIGNAVEP
eukprot:2648338-Rhodomonas_salina.1